MTRAGWADSVVESVTREVGFSWCAVLLADATAGALRLVGEGPRCDGLRPFVERFVPLDGSLCGAVFRAGAPGLVDDLRQLTTEQTAPPAGIRSVMAVPIVRDGQPVGVLAAGSLRAGAFGIDDLDRLVACAAKAAASEIAGEGTAG